MVQLKVYRDEAALTDTTYEGQWFLDLYETEPIKLNLSIEDITNADASSTFSRTFKVPATRHNEEFFQNAYEVDGVDFDVTIKKPAIVLVDGAEFKRGHVRLQKIYTNADRNTIEYELLFLGETRDFASRLADKRMCELVFRDAQGNLDLLPATGNYFTRQEIIDSWQAYPEGATLTSGLHNGDILFPLVDHGNTYDDDGIILDTIIGFGSGNPYFNHQSLPAERLKPMFRAKRTFDQIFADAGYTYESQFLDSATFAQIYVSAFGNNATNAVEPNTVNEYTGWCSGTDDQGVGQRLLIDDAENDPSNSFNTVGSGSAAHTQYNVTVSATPTQPYTMYAECYYEGFFETSNYDQIPINARLNIKKNGTIVASGSWGEGTTLTVSYTTTTAISGDNFWLEVEPYSGLDYDLVNNIYWEVSESPGSAYLPKMFDCEYKQVDFVKDILLAFRLVMEPDPNNKLNFFIEPWQNYIGSGDLHDWSKKLVQDKDIVTEPLFNTQSKDITFDFQPGEDAGNKFHFENYAQIYGHLEFTSNNDLLKGTRKIQFLGIAPTVMQTIEHPNNNPALHNVIIPQVHVHEPGENSTYITQHLPIRPKTRLMFYNGLHDIEDNNYWYLQSGTGQADRLYSYPQVSPYQSFPFLLPSGGTPTADPNLNLSWSNDIKYFLSTGVDDYVDPGTSYYANGFTLYDAYWNRYISSLYNKYSRRMTAYFTLDNTDLQYLTFDDVIFVNGKYWRPEKIIDAQIGRKTAVKCQLITLKDYRPGFANEALTNFSLATTNQLCAGSCDGIITVTTDGTPPFTWTLDNGQTGTYVAAPGLAPYQFDIENVCPGTYTVNVVDGVGRTGSGGAVIGVSTASPIYANHTVTDATDCTAPCNGQISVVAGGGTSPLTIAWSDDPTTNFIRTNLCPGSYTYVVTDANGCSIGASVLVDCNALPTNYEFRQFNEDCTGLGTTAYIVESTATINIGDVYSLRTLRGGSIPGCFQCIGTSTVDAAYLLDAGYADCASCQPVVTPTPTPTPTPIPPTPTPTPTPVSTSFKVAEVVTDECTTTTNYFYIPDTHPYTTDIMEIYDLTTGIPRAGCYQIVASALTPPDSDINFIYRDCVSCQNRPR